MNPNVGDSGGRAVANDGCHHDGPVEVGKAQIDLRRLSAGHPDRDRVVTGIARLQRQLTVAQGWRGMVQLVHGRSAGMLVFVRGWPMVVLDVIVRDVLVHVQRRDRRRGGDESGCEDNCQRPSHGQSL